MISANEIFEIITELGGAASLKDISDEISKKYEMVIFDSHLKEIERILKNNNVFYDSSKNVWDLSQTRNDYLFVSDNILFDKNRDVMLQVFGQSVSSGGSYYQILGTNDYAWFPKFNYEKQGFVNTLEDNGATWKEKILNKESDGIIHDEKRYVFSTEKDTNGKMKKRFTGVFKNVEIESDGTRVYKLIDDKVKIVGFLNKSTKKQNYPKMIVCNISYMKYYMGITNDDYIQGGGGKYPTQNKDGGEKYNFLPHNDGYTYGFVETNYTDSKNHMGDINYAKNISIENIDNDYVNKDYIDGVRVVFISKGPNQEKHVVVGWYDNATIYRKRQGNDKFGYNMKCLNKDAHIIKEEDRNFYYPKKNDDGSHNFGQMNISYPYKNNMFNKTKVSLANDLNNYIDSFTK